MRLWKRLRSLVGRSAQENELNDELRFHLEMKIDQNIAAGMSPDEARYAARRAFGNAGLKREEARTMWGWNWLEHLGQDLRYGLRAMRQSPGFTAVAVLSLALGIGANTAIFSLVDAVLLKTLPVQDPQRLVALSWASKGWPEGVLNGLSGSMYPDGAGRNVSPSFSYPLYEQLRSQNHVFSNVLAMSGNSSELNVGYRGEPGRANGQLVSGTFFDTLGVLPALGRSLSPDDDRADSSPAAVISYGYWDRRFGRDPAIVGKTITLNSVPFTVIGVCPQEFFGVQPGKAVEVWVPLHQQPRVEPRWSPRADPGNAASTARSSLFEARKRWWVVMVARLRPGVSEQQARAEAEVILQQSIASDVKAGTKPETLPHIQVTAGSKGLDDLRRQFSKPLAILMAVVGLVLLIACANVANLLLARGTSRQKEMAVRLAIGARRSRLIRQLLTETVLLAALGGLVGLVLAFWSTDLLVAFMSSGSDPVHLTVTPDPWVLGFTAAVSILTGILFGLSPALRSTRLDLTPALKESSREPAMSSGRRARRLGIGRTLVVAQVSLSLLLLVGAGLFVRTLTNLEGVNAGFNERNLLLFGINPTQDGYKGQRLAEFYQELLRRVAAQPGTRSVSMSGATLIGGGFSSMSTFVQGYPPSQGDKDGGVSAYNNDVGPNFFETLGIPLVLGRTINDRDTSAAPKVVVVNQEFARQFLGGSPVGRRLGFDGKKSSGDYEIVGVVAGAKYDDLRRDVPPTVYMASLQDPDGLGTMHFEVRTAGDPNQMIPAIRRVAQDMDSNLALFDVRSQVGQIGETLFQERLFARLTGFFGVLALLLGCIGVYGVMAFAVTRRTREIGIRMALGASRREILDMVLRETLLLVAIGIALGVLAALEASRLIASLLFGLKPNDPLTIAGAALLMVAAAVFAGYVPARRASRVDPMVALRYE
ncbi:MAG TPA: ABC transporter permease [Terriglobia bacterium]|jgi:predicted permease|nr:ABC transporter permease [Terriglobia bacterium]